MGDDAARLGTFAPPRRPARPTVRGIVLAVLHRVGIVAAAVVMPAALLIAVHLVVSWDLPPAVALPVFAAACAAVVAAFIAAWRLGHAPVLIPMERELTELLLLLVLCVLMFPLLIVLMAAVAA